tara:strand:+ start:503 stop:1927 length:1425 start_codon:yes stop_codon:yes gene_type:complete
MMVDSSPKLSGEPTADALASGLASLGRYGDNYMVHAAEGETIVPKEILESNPGLKDDLFRQMTMMGIENPNRYVVGSDLNSINPITGQPEFFFKKIFKAVKKIAKKILPVAAPIIGNMIAPGIGGIVASGLVSKMQGGSWGDAAKSAALSYGVGALGRGIQGGFAGGPGGFGEGFTSGLGRGLTEPFSAASNLFQSGRANPLAQGIFGPRGPGGGFLFQDLAGTSFDRPGTFGGGRGLQDTLFPSYQTEADFNAQTAPTLLANRQTPQTESDYSQYANPQEPYGSVTGQASTATNVGGGSSGVEQVGDKYIFDGREVVRDIPQGFKAAPQSLAKRLGIPVALALGAAAFLNEEEESVAEQLAQLDQANPKRRAYEKWLTIADKDSEEAKRLKIEWYGQNQFAAGELFSKFGAVAASGGEIIGPGTGTSDSIPARLSDGEFVMTAEAVRNAGGGDRELGAARMYDMMNRFERGVA